MRSLGVRVFSAFMILILAASVTVFAFRHNEIEYPEAEEEASADTEPAYSLDKETVRLWYTDDKLTDYLNMITVEYNSSIDDVRVVPELVSGREYLESISEASMTDEDLPDMYLTTNDNLVKAHLAGLAEGIVIPDNKDLRTLFPKTAIDAVTFHSEYIAYPMFMECSALCYNYSYIHDWARATLEAEIRSTLADEATTGTTASGTSASGSAAEQLSDEEKQKEAERINEYVASQVSEEEVLAFIDEHLPTSYDKLIDFANAYDAPEGVDSVFKWAVNDIFYNYFFVGDAIDVGGAYGDDTTSINIYNENAIRGLIAYQSLNQFFSINTDDVSYQGVIEDFTEGNLVMTIATTDAVSTFRERKAQDEAFDYRFMKLPDINDGLRARSLSVTDVIAINGYSLHKDIANDFALYLCTADPLVLYERTGKVSALTDADFGDVSADIEVFRQEYARSVPLPKMLETSNFWASLEMLFASVWDGADVNEGLRALSEQMMLQITGEEYREEPIAVSEF